MDHSEHGQFKRIGKPAPPKWVPAGQSSVPGKEKDKFYVTREGVHNGWGLYNPYGPSPYAAPPSSGAAPIAAPIAAPLAPMAAPVAPMAAPVPRAPRVRLPRPSARSAAMKAQYGVR